MGSSLPAALTELTVCELGVGTTGAGAEATLPACCAAGGDGSTGAAAGTACVTAGVAAFATVFSRPVTGPAALAGAASARTAISTARTPGSGHVLPRLRSCACCPVARRSDAVGC